MKIQYVSDLHLDSSNFDFKVADCDVIVLAGDISSSPIFTADWIEKHIGFEKPVIYVAGNHEYDFRDIQSHKYAIASALRELENVHFLDNKSIVIDNVKFIGSTLWTGFDAFPELGSVQVSQDIARTNVCDFSSIFSGEKFFSPEDATKLFNDAKAFIFGELNSPFNGKRVVVSHFPPSSISLEKVYRGNPLNPYFISNAEDLLIKSDLWIHGHLHHSVSEKFFGVKVLCNPRGYSKIYNLSSNPKWNPLKVVKV